MLMYNITNSGEPGCMMPIVFVFVAALKNKIVYLHKCNDRSVIYLFCYVPRSTVTLKSHAMETLAR